MVFAADSWCAVAHYLQWLGVFVSV